MSFCTAVNCMDGRVQSPVNRYLRERFGVDYVDVVSEPGPNAILAAGTDEASVASILRRVRISVEKHGSKGIAVVGHHDCTGNPVDRERQRKQTREAVDILRQTFPGTPVIGLWVDSAWQVAEPGEDGRA